MSDTKPRDFTGLIAKVQAANSPSDIVDILSRLSERLCEPDEAKQVDLNQAGVVVAWARAEIVTLREQAINRQPLTDDDINDLKELCRALLECDDIAEQAEIILTIREIANNEPMELVEIKPEDCKPTPKLKAYYNDVASRIRAQRVRRGWNESRLALEARLPVDIILRLECCEFPPNHFVCGKIARALGADIETIYPTWDEEQPMSPEDVAWQTFKAAHEASGAACPSREWFAEQWAKGGTGRRDVKSLKSNSDSCSICFTTPGCATARTETDGRLRASQWLRTSSGSRT